VNKEALVRRHSPVLTKVEPESPLTVGNGEFAFTADVTGFQTLYEDYAIFPLCTMSTWGWHTMPDSDGRCYSFDDVEMTSYKTGERELKYATEPQPGNEYIYKWLRHNPHRLNLARISLMWDGLAIRADELSEIRQELDLYTGVLHSKFRLHGVFFQVKTVCAQSKDALGFSIKTSENVSERLTICMTFPYGSHKKSASDWESPERHKTSLTYDGNRKNSAIIKRVLNTDRYFIRVSGFDRLKQTGEHCVTISGDWFTVAFASDETKLQESSAVQGSFKAVAQDSAEGWNHFWQNGGAVDLSGAKDKRANELERRVVLSQYLSAVHSSGSLPPQETGLACNSWYGKFHLEMHILHAGWFPLWEHSNLLERSLPWYKSILGKAKENAARNGYKGARWPKMVGPEGIDSPSRIATMLVWQQPHILYMLELIRHCNGKVNEYEQIINETAKFMCNFDFSHPLIPAQEEFDPRSVRDPVFELSYWKFGLDLVEKMLGNNYNISLPELPVIDGLYPAHRNCPDTFTKYNRDHPSMLYAFGFIPNDKIDREVMSRTVDKVLDTWDKSTLWGWDFALMAMTLTRLGRAEDAVNILLAETEKNSYTVSGNNFQRGREDLPLYLPGNGSLLLALAMMLRGYGDTLGMVGFPKNGMWDDVKVEGILPLL